MVGESRFSSIFEAANNHNLVLSHCLFLFGLREVLKAVLKARMS